MDAQFCVSLSEGCYKQNSHHSVAIFNALLNRILVRNRASQELLVKISQ